MVADLQHPCFGHLRNRSGHLRSPAELFEVGTEEPHGLLAGDRQLLPSGRSQRRLRAHLPAQLGRFRRSAELYAGQLPAGRVGAGAAICRRAFDHARSRSRGLLGRRPVRNARRRSGDDAGIPAFGNDLRHGRIRAARPDRRWRVDQPAASGHDLRVRRERPVRERHPDAERRQRLCQPLRPRRHPDRFAALPA